MLSIREMDIERADNFWITASSHSLALQILTDHEGEDAFNGPCSLTIFMLVCYIVECLLKAATILSGATPPMTGRDGHNLKRILEVASAAGFKPEIEGLDELVSLLHDIHGDPSFRYGAVESAPLPAIDHTIDFLGSLHGQVTRMLAQHIDVAGWDHRSDLSDAG